MLATGVSHLPLPAMVASLFLLVSGVATATPPATSLAPAGCPDIAGTASSPLSLAPFAFGGLAAPLVGLGGAGTAVPLGLVTVVCAAVAILVHAVTIHPRTRTSQPRSPPRPTV
jgi:DHA1 family bicyclomycin/chloramphenicol resistance-like MFS transporter